MLQLIEEAFYDMALFVVVIVAFPRVSSIDFGWNDHCSAILSYVGEKFGCTESLITQNCASGKLESFQQWNTLFAVVNFSAGKNQANRIAQPIDQSVNLGVLSTARHSDIMLLFHFLGD